MKTLIDVKSNGLALTIARYERERIVAQIRAWAREHRETRKGPTFHLPDATAAILDAVAYQLNKGEPTDG